MVAHYSTGEKYAEHKLTIERIITETDELRSTALQLAEGDAAAFTAVTDAYKLPKDIDKAKANAAKLRSLQDHLPAADLREHRCHQDR